MLIQRLHEPADDEVLYHYCSGQTMIAMLQNGAVRLTDVNLLNDWLEGRWGYRVFEEAADRILKRTGIAEKFPEIERDFLERVDGVLSTRPLHLHPFIACFSKDGDSLSQWRSYADDGRGFAVGICAKALSGCQ